MGRAGCGLADAMNSAYGSGGTGAVGPHQVSDLISGTDHLFHYYDARGNQTLRDAASSDRTALYTADGRLHQVQTGSSKQTRFWYGSDGQRYKSEEAGKKTLYLGNVEIVVEGGVTTTRRTVAGVMLQKVVGSSATNYYLFHNQLGSLARITNASGASVDQLDYMNFGWRRDVDTQHANAPAPALTPRGYTGHEMLDGHALIHMNGRVYDAYQGRFMQPDPVIQAPDNAQSWNAYTYAFNNPHVYTDPTGMMSFREVLGLVIAVVASYFTGQYWIAQNYLAAISVAAVGGFAAGYVSTGTLRGGVYGAFAAVVSVSVGGAFSGWGEVAARAVTGGIMESLQGGNFGNGFFAAGLTAAVMPNVGGIRNDLARTATGAIIGGSISKATGGKFANGAVSGAIQAAMMGGRSKVAYDEGDGAQPMPDKNETPASRREIFDRIVENRELYGIDLPEGYTVKFDDRYMSLVGGRPQYCTVNCDDQIAEYGTVFGQHDRANRQITVFRAGVQPYIASGVRISNGTIQIRVTGRSPSGYQTMVRTFGHEVAHANGIDISLPGAAYHPNAELAGQQAVQRYLNIFRNVRGSSGP